MPHTPRKLGSGMRRPRPLKAPDKVAARELKLFIDNDGDLYRQQHTSINKNLVNKLAAGTFDKEKAVKLFGYLAESGAKKYNKEVLGKREMTVGFFDKPTRELAARELTEDFITEANLGNFDHLLAKKYKGATWRGKRG